MDPNATLKKLLDAYFEEDTAAMAEYAGYLLDWLDQDGFPPDLSDREIARSVAWVLCRCACSHHCLAVAGTPNPLERGTGNA